MVMRGQARPVGIMKSPNIVIFAGSRACRAIFSGRAGRGPARPARGYRDTAGGARSGGPAGGPWPGPGPRCARGRRYPLAAILAIGVRDAGRARSHQAIAEWVADTRPDVRRHHSPPRQAPRHRPAPGPEATGKWLATSLADDISDMHPSKDPGSPTGFGMSVFCG
jgi:hypothetical protein